MSFLLKKGFMFSIVISVILAGCGKSEEEVSNKYLDNISVALLDQATNKNSEHNYEVSLTNEKNEPVNVDSIELILKMKSMNHKVDGKLKIVSKGVYKGKLKLPMDGSWDKIVVLKQGKHSRKVNGASIRLK